MTNREARRRVGEAARLWGELTLAGIAVLAALVLWHLKRRGRLLRDRLGPPRGKSPRDAWPESTEGDP